MITPRGASRSEVYYHQTNALKPTTIGVVRWRHPKLGIIFQRFIPMAESTDLLLRLVAMFQVAVQQAEIWHWLPNAHRYQPFLARQFTQSNPYEDVQVY